MFPLHIVSTSYQTSAKPRGRRETETTDRPSSSRAPSESHGLSLKMTRSVDEQPHSRGSRPDAPPLFLQRNRAFEERPPREDTMSPKTSSSYTRLDKLAKSDSLARTVSHQDILKSTQYVEVNRGQSRSRSDETQSMQETASKSASPAIQAKTSPIISKAAARSRSSSQDLSSQFELPAITPVVVPPNPPLKAPSPAREQQQSMATKHSSTTPRKNSTSMPRVSEAVDPIAAQPVFNKPEERQYRPSYTATPLVSPPHSPQLTQNGGYPGQWYHPPAMYANAYYPAPFSPVSDFDNVNREVGPINNEVYGDSDTLLIKVAGVLPDISRLLHQYRETHGQLSAKDVLASQVEAIHADHIKKLQIELQVTRAEYDKAFRKVVDENDGLKYELQRRQGESRAIDSLVQENRVLGENLQKLRQSNTELKDELDALRQSQSQALEARISEHDRAAAEHKIILSKAQLDLANLITKHTNQKKDLDDARRSESRYRSQLESATKQLEGRNDEQAQQKAATKDTTAEQPETAKSGNSEHHTELPIEATSAEKELRQELDSLRSQLEAQRIELVTEREARERHRQQQESSPSIPTELATGLTSLRTKHLELQQESDKVHRLLISLGYVTGV